MVDGVPGEPAVHTHTLMQPANGKGDARLSSTTKTLPSRRELRLQREAAERARITAESQADHDAAVVQDQADIQDQVAPVEEAQVEVAQAQEAPVVASEIVADKTPTAEIEPIVCEESPSLKSRLAWPPLARPSRGKLLSTAASFATFAMIGAAASVLTVSGVTGALAVPGDAQPEQVAAATIEPTVPDSLKKADGAADSARYFGLERELSGATVRCDVRGGANSLVSAFVEDETYVVNPMGGDSYSLSSNFGWRYDPFTRLPSQHLGQDFAAPVGTPIYSIADGTVIHVGEGIDGRSSNLIVVAHEISGEKYSSWYVHMYDDGVHVELGDQVKAGQHIGDVGSKGRSTGPHLHFELHKGHGLSSEDGSTDHILNPLPTLAALGAVDVSELC